jgi:sarcosine oxidase subunit alpha
MQRGVVLAANAAGYRAALDLAQAGAAVMLVDLRHEGEPGPLADEVRQAGITIRPGHGVIRAVPGSGNRGIHAVQFGPLTADGQLSESGAMELPADGLLMSVGYAPADSLFYQAGGRMRWAEELEQFVPDKFPPGLLAAGRLNGFHSLAEQLSDGRHQGLAAAARLGIFHEELPEPAERISAPANHPYPIFPDQAAKCFLDLDEDVQYKDVVNAAQEGFDQVELLKRYSTFGMGPSQGKLANLNTVRVLAHITGRSVPETGVTRSRPFFHPVPLALLAGRGFHPHRQTSLDARHEAAGAVFMPAGDWRRPAYYAVEGSPQRAIIGEVLAVRQRAGLIDVGTLGKLEVSGPDAGELLERIYTGRFKNMKTGTSRYALACDESGVIIDDGLVARLADDRFYVTTTTTAAAGAYREMQRWAMTWGLGVVLANVTGHSGAINLAGPQARAILQSLADVDLSSGNMPYLAVREGRVADVPARLLRVGFVGEWGCEIHVPAFGAPRVWDAIVEAGRNAEVRPFGVEAQRILRLEKGHLIVSQDTDGLTHPLEANMAWAVKADKPFYIGQRSLAVLRRQPLKRLLVGFMLDGDVPPGAPGMPKECHLVVSGDEIRGRVTSITYSPTLQRVIGLAFLPPDSAQPGTPFEIRIDDGSLVPATVVPTPFYDPKNLRQSTT